MFERILKAAGGSAEAVSRRAFFGGVGRLAAAAAAVGLAVTGGTAQARVCPPGYCLRRGVCLPCGRGGGR